MKPNLAPESPLLVCHCHLRWVWGYQRPQHLLSRLEKHWPVLVEEGPLIDDRPPGVEVLSVAEGVAVLRPHHPAGRGHLPVDGRARARKKPARVKADDTKSLIVVGGPAGLSVGLHLDDSDFVLARRHAHPGGLCRSIVEARGHAVLPIVLSECRRCG